MKLIVQIPCLNEEESLPATLRAIPRSIPGFDQVEVLVIDDGCTDRTVEVAKENGADHILRFTGNRGLGQAFAAGIDRCLMLGADVIVNTDGDHQYDGRDIPALVQPILEGRADIVIGDRQVQTIARFSPLKRQLQALGSRVVSRLAGIEVPDVASGFRAYSREAAMCLVRSSEFDHSVDHVIQAGRRRIVTRSVPVRTNENLRDSRLFSNPTVFVARSLGIMVRTYASYRALTIFTLAGLAAGSLGFLLGLRFLYFYWFDPATRDLHVQSLILAAILLLAGFQMILTGIVADLVNSHRAISEDISYRLRRLELRERGKPPGTESAG
jgi:glycosyltransferase involved in cell wall biosynthesis